MSADAGDAELFVRTWAALREAVAGLHEEAFARPSGCAGRLVRDLGCHPVIDAQDVLITLTTPAEGEPTADALSYWNVGTVAPPGEEPLDALTVRLAAAYQDPALLTFHLDDVGSAAGRAAALADPAARVGTQDMVLTVDGYLGAYVMEWTLHHLDLVAHLPGVPGPPTAGLARAHSMLELIAGDAFPASFTDSQVLLVGTGRGTADRGELAELGALGAKLPFVLD